jgi:hypothetical protein
LIGISFAPDSVAYWSGYQAAVLPAQVEGEVEAGDGVGVVGWAAALVVVECVGVAGACDH